MILEGFRLKTRLKTCIDIDCLVSSTVERPAEVHIVTHRPLEEAANFLPGRTFEDEARPGAPSGVVSVTGQLLFLVLEDEVLMERIVDRDVVEVLQNTVGQQLPNTLQDCRLTCGRVTKPTALSLRAGAMRIRSISRSGIMSQSRLQTQ